MTKAELSDAVRECLDPNCSQRGATDLVEATLAILKDTLSQGVTVKLSSFGTFDTTDKKARMGRNPQTGEPIVIEARRVVRFKPSQKLRAKLNSNSNM